jgi:type 1 fimbria pilin
MLKRILATTAVLTLLALAPLTLAAQAHETTAGNEMTITGQVVDLNCYVTNGASGAGHKACAQACAKAGVPLGILASDGTIYVPVSSKPGDPQNAKLAAFTEGKVKVTGTHRMSHGLHTIEIKTVSAAT